MAARARATERWLGLKSHSSIANHHNSGRLASIHRVSHGGLPQSESLLAHTYLHRNPFIADMHYYYQKKKKKRPTERLSLNRLMKNFVTSCSFLVLRGDSQFAEFWLRPHPCPASTSHHHPTYRRQPTNINKLLVCFSTPCPIVLCQSYIDPSAAISPSQDPFPTAELRLEQTDGMANQCAQTRG